MPELTILPIPAAVLFDLDGTLIDSVETRIAAWLDALEQAGLPTTHERLAPLIGLDGRRLAREIAAIAGRPIEDARAKEIDRRAGERYEDLNREPRPLPGVGRLIEVLEDRDITWAIATSSRKEQVGPQSRRSAFRESRKSSTQATSRTLSPSPTSCSLPRNN